MTQSRQIQNLRNLACAFKAAKKLVCMKEAMTVATTFGHHVGKQPAG